MVFKKVLLAMCLAAPLSADTGYTNTIRVTETDNSPACTVGQLKVTAGALTCSGQTATIATGGGASSLPLPQGATNYIQNNPSIVQVATMSITGQAGFNDALFQTYTSSPTSQANGSMWMAQDAGSTLPCIFFFYGGARYHMCGCPDSGPNNNSGQCQGFLCGVTYP